MRIVDFRIVNHRIFMRCDDMEIGEWLEADSKIDAIFVLVAHVKKIKEDRHLQTYLSLRMDLDRSVVSRVRHGRRPVPELWVLRIHEYSGLDLDSIRLVLDLPKFKYVDHKRMAIEADMVLLRNHMDELSYSSVT